MHHASAGRHGIGWSRPAAKCFETVLVTLWALALHASPALADLSQFQLIGTLQGHRYYVSTATMTWQQANALCTSIPNGHLATISDAAENDFVAHGDLNGGHSGLWIGLSDEGHPGTWTWVNGETGTYRNWAVNQPNEGNETVACINPYGYQDVGHWHDQTSTTTEMPAVLEIDECAPPVGFESIGTLGGHQYFVSTSVMSWTQANTLCASIPNGHLATISDATENDFVAHGDLAGGHSGLWIGLTDEGHEGTWTWINGETGTYRNWAPGQPEEGSETVACINPYGYVQAGYWHDQNATTALMPAVLEIDRDCASPSGAVHECVAPALAIPDNSAQGVSSTIDVTATGRVLSVTVDVDLTHTWIGDLVLELSHAGRTVRLHSQTGNSSDDIVGTYPTTLPVDGPGALEDFVNVTAQGGWTLRVVDLAGGDDGTLNSWCIGLQTDPVPDALCEASATPIPDYDPTGVARVFTVTDNGCVATITVDVDLTHTWIGDLVLQLSHRDKTVRLHNHSGGSGDDIVGTYPTTLAVDGPGALAEFLNVPAQGEWTLRVIDEVGSDVGTLNSWCLNLTYVPNTTGIGESIVDRLQLAAPSPNPLRGGPAMIRWAAPRAAQARLRIYDIAGRLVRTLIDERIEAGQRATPWDGRDDSGNRVDAGVYLCRLEVDGDHRSRRIVLLR